MHLREGPTDRQVFEEVFVERVYVPYLAMTPDPTRGGIVDLGANIGLSAVFLARAFPRAPMVAVEPDAGNFAVLLENLRSCGFASRCTALQAFAGAERGFAELQDSGNGAWGM